MKVKLNTAVIRYIEYELYNYKSNIEEACYIEEDTVDGAGPGCGERVQTSTTGDPTSQKAIKLISNKRLLNIKRNITNIERGLRIIKTGPEEKKYELIELKYFKAEDTDKKIAKKLNISIETYYRWKREVITTIAIQMGLVG